MFFNAGLATYSAENAGAKLQVPQVKIATSANDAAAGFQKTLEPLNVMLGGAPRFTPNLRSFG
jgi:hypothetical protein